MRLLNVHDFGLVDFHSDAQRPSYVIASHRWADEITYQEFLTTPKTDAAAKSKKGLWKILQFCTFVRLRLHVDWLWIDTCCIDKSSSAELQEAINSMFRWYKDAVLCLAYLHDLPPPQADGEQNVNSIWFSRGWTLQELLAPKVVLFLNAKWVDIGRKGTPSTDIWKTDRIGLEMILSHHEALETSISEITGIPQAVLEDYASGRDLSIEEKLKWMDGRTTTRIEDRAYCLLGICEVYMPLIYGEREEAMERLEEAIERKRRRQKNRLGVSGTSTPARTQSRSPAPPESRPSRVEELNESANDRSAPPDAPADAQSPGTTSDTASNAAGWSTYSSRFHNFLPSTNDNSAGSPAQAGTRPPTSRKALASPAVGSSTFAAKSLDDSVLENVKRPSPMKVPSQAAAHDPVGRGGNRDALNLTAIKENLPVSTQPAPGPKHNSPQPGTSNLPTSPLKAIAIYDYTKGEENEISFAQGDLIEEIDKVSKEWWLGTNRKTGASGLFPYNYVNEAGVTSNEVPDLKPYEPAGLRPRKDGTTSGTALFDFTAQREGDISFPKGARLWRLEAKYDDWWEGEYGERRGLMPSNHIKLDESTTGPRKQPRKDGTSTAKATYTFEKQEEGDLGFPRGAMIERVVAKYEDWWEGEYAGTRGFFPANYVELPDELRPDKTSTATAVSAHNSDKPWELVFPKGAKITRVEFAAVVYQQAGTLMWAGQYNGRRGVFPAHHVKLDDEDAAPARATQDTSMTATAIRSYAARDQRNEISFRKGAKLTRVAQIPGSTWWEGDYQGKRGAFPGSHYIRIDDDEGVADNRQRKLPRPDKTSKATAIAPYNSRDSTGISFGTGARITNIEAPFPNKGCWVGDLSDGKRGTFLSNYVVLDKETGPALNPTEVLLPSTSKPPKPKQTRLRKDKTNAATALFAWESNLPGDLSFPKGAIITNLESPLPNNDEWWIGSLSNGKAGMFPSNRVRLDHEVPAAISQKANSASSQLRGVAHVRGPSTSQQQQQLRDIVFCHECEKQWYRDEHEGMMCPYCQSDFTEISDETHPPKREGPEETHRYTTVTASRSEPVSQQSNSSAQAMMNMMFGGMSNASRRERSSDA